VRNESRGVSDMFFLKQIADDRWLLLPAVQAKALIEHGAGRESFWQQYQRLPMKLHQPDSLPTGEWMLGLND